MTAQITWWPQTEMTFGVTLEAAYGQRLFYFSRLLST